MYPEHEKLNKVIRESQSIGEFLDWLRSEKEFELGQWRKDRIDDAFMPVHVSTEKLLAEFFEIDLDKLEQEKRAMIASLQED